MAKITYHQLVAAKAWEAWGDKLGWKYVHCETGTPTVEPFALFATGDKDRTEKVSLLMRQALERGNPEQSNVTHIKEGTDG